MSNKNLSQQIQTLMNQFYAKNFDIVISKGNLLLKKNPEYVILYNLVGSAYQNNGDYINAKLKFEDGIKLDSKNLALMNNLGLSHKNLLEYESSEKLFLEIIHLNKKYVNAYINLGNLKRDLNQFDDAIKFYEEALKITKENPVIYYSLALAHQGIGNFDKCVFYSTKTLEIDSNFTRADHLISQSKKYTLNDEHYKSLKKKIDKFNENSLEKIDIYFSLAKAEEDLGNIKEASENLIIGNKLKKRSLNYDIRNEIRLFDDIKKKFKKESNSIQLNKNDKNIIFILGMPRSGTSLVEQIISSHSNVFGGGELPILSNLIKNNFIENENSLRNNFLELMKDTSLINEIKKSYLKYIDNFKFKEKYITDKAPLNFRWIGFIEFLFPESKIIHCTRDPKNNCLSMFKNLFEGSLNFTYSQEDLVDYYQKYQDLMNFWKSNYQNNILEVNYEDLIENNENKIKEIIKFCNLEWDEKCLSFHENKSPIKTMSTSQARKPIYKSSLNPFDKFKTYLSILEEKL